MSPARIVEEALAKGLSMIAITDHNSTRQCKAVMEVGQGRGLMVIGGAEVNTREEVHCVTLFENLEKLEQFQLYLDEFLPDIPNNPDKFGHQVWVNKDEEIEGIEERLLLSGLDQSIDDVEQKVHSLGGLFIPAHVDRPLYGIFGVLGFIPPDLKCDALEVSANAKPDFFETTKIKDKYPIVSNSDAHYPEDIGKSFTLFNMENATFEELKKQIKIKN
jgi:PHP family Zn ribbon phosphoesterase